jgi:glutamyl-tRNA reductase
MVIEMKRPTKTRYIIMIGEDETPAACSRELQPGVITIMITARTPEEAEDMRKEYTAVIKTAI